MISLTFLETILFNVMLNAFTGHYIPNWENYVRSKRAKRALVSNRIFGDICVTISLITTLTRLLSPDVGLVERCNGAFTSITTVQSVFKIIHYLVNKKRFIEIFQMMDKSLEEIPFTDEEERIMEAERRHVKKISMLLIAMMAGPAIPYGLLPFVPFAQEAHGGRFLSVPSWFPFDHLVSPAFEYVVVFQTLAGWYVISRSVTFDAFFFSIASCQIVQLKKLKSRMGHIFESPEEDSSTSVGSEPDEASLMILEPVMKEMRKRYIVRQTNVGTETEKKIFQMRLKDWVTQHQHLISIGNKLQSLYSPMLVMQFFTTTVILCFSSFVSVTVSLDVLQYMLSAIFCASNVVQLYLVCRYGDRIYEANLALSDAAWSNNWHLHPAPEIRSSLKIIFQRVQIPLQLSALGVFPLSSVTFMEITRAAISYLMVITELYRKSS